MKDRAVRMIGLVFPHDSKRLFAAVVPAQSDRRPE